MPRRHKLYRRILLHPRRQKRNIRHKRIILRRNQQHRHAHIRRHPFRPRRLVIFLRIAKPKARRRNRIVKLPHRSNRPKPIRPIPPRKHLRLPRIPRHQPLHKMPRVQIIVPPLQRIRARRQIKRRTHRANPSQRRRKLLAILPGHLRHQIPAHRVPGEKHPLESINARQLLQHRPIIPAHPRVI